MPDSARWTRINELFHAAVAKSAAERAAFLLAQCGSDAALRAEVESLLAQPASTDGFLGKPAVVFAAQMITNPGWTVLTGRRIGAYQLQAPLGAGGMGEVYRARDTKLGRDVAIKILPRVFTSDPERLARFEREARMLAALNHPHVGAIYGVEEADGVPALVLELVEGPTLADRLQRGPGARRNQVVPRTAHARVSIRTDGNRTVVGCIKRRWRRDVCDRGEGNFRDVRRVDRSSAVCWSVPS